MSNVAPQSLANLNRSGRRPGSFDIRTMILKALDKVGGVDYLAKQAIENPTAFLGLIAKVMPTQLTNADGTNVPWVVVMPAEADSVDDWFRMYAPKHIQEARKLEHQQAKTIEGDADAEDQSDPA